MRNDNYAENDKKQDNAQSLTPAFNIVIACSFRL